jgi:hypothetical protein
MRRKKAAKRLDTKYRVRATALLVLKSTRFFEASYRAPRSLRIIKTRWRHKTPSDALNIVLGFITVLRKAESCLFQLLAREQRMPFRVLDDHRLNSQVEASSFI